MPSFPSFFLFHWYIPWYPHPGSPEFPFCLRLEMGRNVDALFCTRGKEKCKGTHCRGAPLAWHTGGPGGMRNAESRPWGLLTAGDPSCHTIAYSHRTDRDKARGWSTTTKQKRSCFSEKRKVMIQRISECRATGRWEGNTCWLPLDEDNEENQTVSYYNREPQ